MLLLRRDGLPVATVAMLLTLDGNSRDCMPVPAATAVLGDNDDDGLLTAWTSRMVFCGDELPPTGRLDSTRPLLQTDITPRLLLVNGLPTEGDDDDNDDAATIQSSFDILCH